jgi:ubiquinone/menaquinone biosynthesis C-methylase UbiE
MSDVLEIGPGTVEGKSIVFPDADTVDLLNNNATYQASWGYEQLPISDNKYKHVFASHVLEHVPWYRIQAALKEVIRILKPGGVFEVYVPNFDYIVDCYSKKKCGDTWRVFNKESDWMTWVNGRTFSYGEDAVELLSAVRPIPQTMHKTIFTPAYLLSNLTNAGFQNAAMLKIRRYGTSHGPIEMGAIAYK